MAIPMPPFIKSLFETFPLIQYPPIHPQPAPTTSRNSRSIPASCPSSIPARPSPTDPTLFVRSRHSPSLAAQLLLLRVGGRAVNIWLSHSATTQSDEMPYVYVHGAGGSIIQGDALQQWLLSSPSSSREQNRTAASEAAEREQNVMDRAQKSAGGLGSHITDSILAFNSLLTVLEETHLLASHLDATQRHVLGVWRDSIMKPSLQMTRLLSVSWETQLLEAQDALVALSTFIESAEMAAGEREADGVMRIKAALVAQVHVVLGAQRGKCVVDLQEMVNQFPILLNLHDAWINQYGKHLLY